MDHKLNLKKQLACIYTSDFFSGLRITDAVWVALLAARGFSLWEIGLAESVFHIVSLLCEVPSGMAADLLGRKKTLVSGGVCMVLQSLLMAFASDLFTICFAMGLNALAMTMFSGTTTALLYDSLKQEGCEEKYIQVSANSSQISMLANAIGSLASLLKRFLGFAGFYLRSPSSLRPRPTGKSTRCALCPNSSASWCGTACMSCTPAQWQESSSHPAPSSACPAT